MRAVYTTDQIRKLIAEGKTYDFYNDTYWRHLSHEIMREQNNECQLCKKRGRYTPAVLVHHVRELKQAPELAYSRWQDDECTVPQLIALCQNCHEQQHPNRFGNKDENHYINDEWW